MATIEDFSIIRTMLENGGTYPGDPPVSVISTYLTNAGKRVYHVCLSQTRPEAELFEAVTSPHVHELELLWDRFGGLTETERLMLALHAAHREATWVDCRRLYDMRTSKNQERP